MTITYHAGRRIQGLSTDIVNTPTFEDDFSTDKGWVVNDANKINVDYTTNNRIDYDIIRDDTNDKAYIDLGTTVSDTAWVLRFHHYLTTFSGTINKQMMVGLSDNTASSAVTSQDVIYMNLNLQDNKYYFHSVDNAIISASSTSDLGVTPTNSQEFWFEMIRTSATTATLTAYSDSTYSTVAYTTNYSIASTTDNLRYIFVDHRQNPSTDSGTLVGYIDDIEFYNGVSSLSSKPTNVQSGSRFEETDTRKIYYYEPQTETTATYKQESSNAYYVPFYAYNELVTEYVDTNSVLVGKTIKKVGFGLSKVGSPTGTLTFGVFNGSGSLLHTFGSVDVSTLTSYGYPPSNWDWFERESSTAYTISAGEYIGARLNRDYSGSPTDGSNHVVLRAQNTNPFDGTNSYVKYSDVFDSISWNTVTGSDLTFRFYLYEEWTEEV